MIPILTNGLKRMLLADPPHLLLSMSAETRELVFIIYANDDHDLLPHHITFSPSSDRDLDTMHPLKHGERRQKPPNTAASAPPSTCDGHQLTSLLVALGPVS
jgi:hypothetical protein